MEYRFVEVTDGTLHGKFMIGVFGDDDHAEREAFSGALLLRNRGWSRDHFMLFDLQTGEGALFRPGGRARFDLHRTRICVCPVFEVFLDWLYTHIYEHGPEWFHAIPRKMLIPPVIGIGSYRRPHTPHPDDTGDELSSDPADPVADPRLDVTSGTP